MVTKKETYLYGQLVSLTRDNLAALDKHLDGRLGIWGKTRLSSRSRRINEILRQIFFLKSEAGNFTVDHLLIEIDKDLDALHRTWDDVTQEELKYMKSLTAFVRDNLE